MRALPSYPNPHLRRWAFAAGVPRPNLWYRLCRRLFQVTFAAVWKVRVFNRHHEPARGSVLYICNHQSFLDPILMSLALRRPMNYMARESLFRQAVFGRIIRSLNAFPVRRAAADTRALKEALRRLRRGEQLVVFPEGTRTRDGSIGPFLPGVSMLARRGADWVVPVLIDGAFECWPRTQRLPRPGHIVVAYAPALRSDEVRAMPADQFIRRVHATLTDLQRQLRRRLGRPPTMESRPATTRGK